jgi:hypothetical protein
MKIRWIAVCGIVACTSQQGTVIADAGSLIAKTIVCVDKDLSAGMTPAATAIDCGLRDAKDVEDLVGAAERLSAHRAMRGRDAAAE